MAVNKLQVFLASRFEEFRDLRFALASRLNSVKQLAVEAIDLNDRFPDKRPAIERCYEAIDRAEVFVLLIGRTYGEGVHRPDGESYTHLEYRRAIQDRSKIILPYTYGSLAEILAKPDCDPRLRAWLREIGKLQTPGRLDPALDSGQLASNIFEVVLDRLWEIYWGIAEPIDAGDDEDETSIWDDSPVKLEELVGYKHLTEDGAAAPLRALAANHVMEALDALQLKLPQIAIKHLRAAVELVPLDVVPSYWLARLQIATGRRVECAQGLSYALQCARVAARHANQLRQMMALILAARANERLERREAAIEAAGEAHDVMSHHWLPKVELGRQHALSHDPSRAFGFAKEAFWLRPESIRQIERDPAYRAFGKAFDRFSDQLYLEVHAECEAVFDVESDTCVYAQELLAGVAGFEPGGRFVDVPDREALSSVQLVRSARDAARHTLDLLQQCAKRLVVEGNAFENHGFRGLSRATLDAIEQARDAERKKIKEAEERRKRARQASARSGRTLQGTALIGAAVVVCLIGTALGQSDPDWRVRLLLAAGVAVIITFAVAMAGMWPSYSASRADARAASDERSGASKKLTIYDAAADAFHSATGLLRDRVIGLSNLVYRFEATAAKRVSISPAATIFREKRRGDIIRVDGKEQVYFETELLPAALQFIAPEKLGPRSKHWFVRYLGPGDPEMYSRSAALRMSLYASNKEAAFRPPLSRLCVSLSAC